MAEGGEEAFSNGTSYTIEFGSSASHPPRIRSGSGPSPKGSPPSGVSRKKTNEEQLIATPKGSRPIMPYSAPDLAYKRSQFSLSPFGSLPRKPLYTGLDATVRLASPDSVERRAARLGAELNLATPIGSRRSSSLGVGRPPVPKAWSSFILSSGDSSMLLDASRSLPSSTNGLRSAFTSESSSASDPARMRLDSEDSESVQARLDELQASYRSLAEENAKLKALMTQKSSSAPSPAPASPRYTLGSRAASGEILSGERDPGFGFGHPDSEKIMQAETKELDNSQMSRVKTAARQVFSVKVLLRSLEETVKYDRALIIELERKISSMADALETLQAENARLRTTPTEETADHEVPFESNSSIADVTHSFEQEKGVD